MLKDLLESLLAARDPARDIAHDPLVVVRRYTSAHDREAAAWLASLLSYGRVASILASLEDLFGRMPEGPGAFIGGFDAARDTDRLSGFVHRWTTGDDLARLLVATKTLTDRYGTLEAAFVVGDDPGEPHIGQALGRFAVALRAAAPSGPRSRALKWLVAEPAGGSAAKRFCLFLRWVVRPDDGQDLGLWSQVDPARLIVPLDTHIFRIGRYLGLTDRRTAGWKAALDITDGLRRLNPDDPLIYDLALSHLGILGDCPSRPVERICRACSLRPACRHWMAQVAPTAPSVARVAP